jgi:hypothetical protein
LLIPLSTTREEVEEQGLPMSPSVEEDSEEDVAIGHIGSLLVVPDAQKK